MTPTSINIQDTIPAFAFAITCITVQFDWGFNNIFEFGQWKNYQLFYSIKQNISFPPKTISLK